MTVVSVVKDVDTRTLTITARFDAPVARVWQVWSDPRQLERWWGPPGYPATVLEHDLAPGGSVRYFMTGPDGERHGGWFGVRAAEPPHALELDTAFGDAEGNPIPGGSPGVIRVALAELAGDATQMTITASWETDEAMAEDLAMGMETGLRDAVGQIDEILRRTP